MAYTNSQICMAWANNEDKHHSAPSMSHWDGRLYSYSTCIGQRLEYDGKTMFIIDNNTYSPTTNTHQSIMRSVIPEGATVFNVPFVDWGRDSFMAYLPCVRDFIHRAFDMIAADLKACIDISTSNVLDHGFNHQWYREALRLLEFTKASTVKQILRMKADVFSAYVDRTVCHAYHHEYYVRHFYGKEEVMQQKFRTFLRLMVENASVSEIVDAVNGKGTWEAYLKRTQGARKRRKALRLSKYVDYPIKYADIEKHSKAGDLISWLYEKYRYARKDRENFKAVKEKTSRLDRAKRHLERYCGMTGWSFYYWRNAIKSFDYDGVTINFRDSEGNRIYCYKERCLSDDEYKEFYMCSDKRKWIHDKRKWMLQQLEIDYKVNRRQ